MTIALGLALAAIGLAHDPLAPAADPKRLALIAIAIVVTALMLVKGRREVRPGLPHAAAVAAIGLAAISLTWGVPRGALDLGAWVAAAALSFAVAARGRLFAMKTTRAAALLLGGAVALHAIVGLLRGARGAFVDGGQGNANWLGLVLAVTLPVTIDALRAHGRWAAASVALQAFALGASHARVAWVAVAIAVAVIALKKRRREIAALAMVAIVGAYVARGTSVRSAKPSLPYEAPVEVAAGGRAAIAKTAARAAVASLPFGAGLGRFADAYRDAEANARRSTRATTAHDEALHIAVESGPLAALCMLVALVVAAFQLRRWRAGAAAMIAVTITSFGDDPLHKPPVLAMIALLFAALPRGRSLGRKFALSSVPPALVAMASLAILLVPALRAWRSDRLVTRAEMAAPFERQAILERAAAIDRGSPDALLALGLARFDAGDLDGAATVLARARSLDDDAATSIALGNVEAARDDLVSAETAFRHAIERSPGNFRAHVDLAEILRRQGRLEDARHVARVARALRPWDVAIVDLEERLSEDAAGG